MRVRIRPDICLALRLIGIQEMYRQKQDFMDQMMRDMALYGTCAYKHNEDGSVEKIDLNDLYFHEKREKQ